jgi:hypothetical protein
VTAFRFIVGQPQVLYLDGINEGGPAPTPDPGTIALLDGTKPLVLLTTATPGTGYSATTCSGPAPLAPLAWQGVYMIRFTSEAEEEAQFAAGGVPACVSWIMYDNEQNTEPPTPPNELTDPPTYMLRAAYVAHAHGKRFMATAGDSVPALRETLYSFASQYDAYDEQIQTSECPSVASFVSHLVEMASNFQRYNRNIAIAAGFGDAIESPCIPGGTGPLTYVPPSYVSKYLDAFPSNVTAWGNYGPKTPQNNGNGMPAYYGDWSTVVHYSLSAPPRTPLPLPAPTPANTNTPIPTLSELEDRARR